MSERIRVLQVVEATTAGTKKHVLSFVQALDRTRFQVAVACPRVRSHAYGDTSFASEVAAAEVDVIFVNMRREVRLLDDARAVVALYRVILAGGYDVVHAHSSKAGVTGRIAGAGAGVPAIVYTPHGFAFCTQPGGRTARLALAAERWLARRTNAIVCVSEAERHAALAYRVAPPDRLVVIRNGFDACALAVDPNPAPWKEALRLPPDTPVVGTIARLELEKGLGDLVAASRHILVQRPGTQFVIVGDGALRQLLEAQARELGVAAQVHFTGFRPDAQDVLRAFDVFVLPSLYEGGLPYSILEALALAKPVVATAAGGIVELIDDGTTGLLVPPGDPAALARAVLRLLDSPETARVLGAVGRTRAESQPSVEQMARQTEQLYVRLLARAGRA